MDEKPDVSHDLDLVTVFRSAGINSEMEAVQVKSLLEASGIEAVFIGDGILPNLPDEVRVAKEDAVRAEQLIQEALAAGPEAAAEAEEAGETS